MTLLVKFAMGPRKPIWALSPSTERYDFALFVPGPLQHSGAPLVALSEFRIWSPAPSFLHPSPRTGQAESCCNASVVVSREPEEAGVGLNWKLWVVVALVVLLGVFVLQNTKVVEVRLLFWKLEMSRSVLLLGVLGSGIAMGWLLRSVRRT